MKTIFSLSSGAGVAGVAVIRVSGQMAEQCLHKMCRKIVQPNIAQLRNIYDPQSGEKLDQGLVFWFPEPATFTGENVVEFHIHGGKATISGVLAALGKLPDFELAQAGEFTRRAFLNGKLDLVEVEGLGDLLNAETPEQRRQALNQSDGHASKLFESWRERLISVLGYLEASIDFIGEEDVDEKALQGLEEKLILLRNDIAKKANDAVRGEAIREGVRIVLVGEPNVGKSSILNYLAKRDVAIVSDKPGTTRDVLEVQMQLNGLPVIFADTAGLNDDPLDAVEKEGIRRTKQRSVDADIVIEVYASQTDQQNLGLVTSADVVQVWNKSDLYGFEDDSRMQISAKTGQGMELFISRVSKLVGEKFGGEEPAVVTRERQKTSIEQGLSHINSALDDWKKTPELAAEQLRLASDALSRLVGRIDVEDLLDTIFRDFCVGK